MADSPILEVRADSLIEGSEWYHPGQEETVQIPRKKALPALAAILFSLAAEAAPPAREAWLDDLETARQKARREDKLLLVDLWADWCTWCKRLDEQVFTSEAFREYAEGHVLLRVDTEDEAEGTRLQETFGVAALPTTLILSHELVKVGELQGFAPAQQYIQNLELEKALYWSLLRAYEDVDGGTSSETLETLADELHSRRDGQRAATLYERLLGREERNAEEEAWNRYYYADSLRLAGSVQAAREALAKARAAARAVDNEELLELADLLVYRLARDAGACSEAKDALESYLAAHPQGIHGDAARAALERLNTEPLEDFPCPGTSPAAARAGGRRSTADGARLPSSARTAS